MKLKETANLISQLFEIEEILIALSMPDGRWRTLQTWLKKHPLWRKQLNAWLDATPDVAFISLRDWIGKEAEIPLVMLKAFINQEIETRVKKAIETFQQLYKARQAADERKEIAG